ncbi:MAG TPA: cytochrome c oxidase assembly protein [Gaiellaceae bacterium]|jgi:cytochrome c oxidase assembly factor CtaG|nr:cytochrome c oxidase assembly protein [Gaiellaceae bacterium]
MHFSAEAVALAPALALAYALLVRRRSPSRLQVTAAAAGIALVFLAFFTQLQPLALHTFLWAHLLQNVVLAEWAPALLVFAIPSAVAARVRVPPLAALPVWVGTYFAWHLPWVYDFALQHPHSVLHVEHATYLAAGVALWWPVVHGPRSAGAKAAYLFAAFVLASPLGLLLALIPRPIYSFYEHAPRTWGPGPLVDQQIAGVTMALEQAVVFFAAFTYFLLRFLRDEQAEGLALGGRG